jgi:PA-IL-like protein
METKLMWKRTVLSVFCAAALLFTGAAYAQDSATLTLRSGEKVSGQLVDLGGVGFTLRVNGNERNIPQNDVSVIDFTGGTMTDADWAKFNGTSMVVLRNGSTFDGSLYDIGGTSPLRLTIRTSTGEREVGANEVARIVISRPENVAVATSGTNPGIANTPPVPGAITVQANQPWTSTGITVRKGQTIYLTTTGEVQLSDDANDIANANGAKSGRTIANGLLKNALAGALVGKIGPNGVAFGVGGQSSITAPAAGVLYLGVNDDGFGDNRGNYQVIIR